MYVLHLPLVLLLLAGCVCRELQFSKTWLVTLGDQDDIATRLKFRAGIDTSTWRSYAR